MLTLATSDGIHLLDGPARTSELAGHDVRAVVADGKRWLALVDGHSVWQRPAEGDWAELVASDDELTCASVLPGWVLLGTSGAHLLRMSDAALIEGLGAFEHAPSRDEWYTPWGGPPDVRSMAVAGDGTLYVNVHVGGILRSADGGASWAATIDLHADVHQVICPRQYQPDLVLAACADGLAVSRDAGASWRLRDEGLRGTYCRAVAVAGDTVIVSASDGPDGGQVGVYRAPLDKGWARLERCGKDLPSLEGNIDTCWLAGEDGLLALVDPAGRVFTSSDQGTSWNPIGEGLGQPRSLAWL